LVDLDSERGNLLTHLSAQGTFKSFLQGQHQNIEGLNIEMAEQAQKR